MKITKIILSRWRLALAGMLLLPTLAMAERMTKTVYTATNSPEGNRILVYERTDGGKLRYRQSFPTGGAGTGTGLGNQSGVIMSENDEWLLAVNAGSSEISVFAVSKDWLILTDVVSSGGKQPISLAIDHNLVYVLNAGGAVGDQDNVAGFYLSDKGRLKPIAHSQRLLSAANVGPAQVGFAPSGNALVVTEKGTNLIDSFPVDDSGMLGARVATNSNGATPFGFAFGRHDRLIVSEAFGGAANASAVSSYQVNSAAHLSLISGSVPTTESAACWVVIARDGRFAYTTNTASNTISGYAVSNEGKLKLLRADGISATTGNGPIDAAVTDDDRFLYALNSGDNTISGFAIAADGKLTPVETEAGLPAGANGLVAR